LRIDQGTLGVEQLVFGVQQIQQRALTDLELLLEATRTLAVESTCSRRKGVC
jgi:hypothetical protein